MIDIKINYLSEIGCGEFTAVSLSVVKHVGEENEWIRTINEKSYIDPDSKSKKLYEDLFQYNNNQELPSGNYIKCIEVAERNKNGQSFLN